MGANIIELNREEIKTVSGGGVVLILGALVTNYLVVLDICRGCYGAVNSSEEYLEFDGENDWYNVKLFNKEQLFFSYVCNPKILLMAVGAALAYIVVWDAYNAFLDFAEYIWKKFS